jgi:hypothetical protein
MELCYSIFKLQGGIVMSYKLRQRRIKFKGIWLVATIVGMLGLLSGIVFAQGGAQAFAVKAISQVKATRVNIWTAQQPAGYNFIIGITGICTTLECYAGTGFWETGYIKGIITPVQNQLQQFVSYANINGSITTKYGLGNLIDNNWYTFQTLYSNTAQRWEAWRDGQVIWFPPSPLNFTYRARAICGPEGSSDGVPLGVECNNMQYKTTTVGWTLYDYTSTQISGRYCVFKPYTYGAFGWGPC